MKFYRTRRYFQVFFFVIFFIFLTLTVWPLGRVYLGAFLLADPLVTINSLVNGVFKWEMMAALVVIVSPFLLGRVFCGYVCPMGFIVELTSQRDRRPPETPVLNASRKAPPFILGISLVLLTFGVATYLVFDPLVLLTRSSATLLYPLLDRLARLSGDILYLITPLRPAIDVATSALAGNIIFQKPLVYQLQVGIFAMFASVLLLSFIERRMWCRDLCPLGSLLGFLSRFSIFGRVVDESACIKCRKCEAVCPMGAVRETGQTTDKTRCQMGFECADVCPKNAVSFGLKPKSNVYDPARRTFLAAIGLSALAGFFLSTSITRREKNVLLIRPPGSRGEAAFTSLCSRCGQCIKVCPTNVLQPSLTAAGLEGVFTPQMNYDNGYCDWNCNECGKVCPTGAINKLTLPVKRKTVIGRAYIDRNRCIPWADYKNCLVCEELCPIPDKAIKFEKVDVKNPQGKTVKLKRPVVIAEKCIGCGICEANCPVAYNAAINVRATGQRT